MLVSWEYWLASFRHLCFSLLLRSFSEDIGIYISFSNPPSDAWKDDLIIEITCLLWALCPSVVAGYTATFISEKKEFTTVIISIVVLFVAVYLITNGEFFNWNQGPIILQFIVMIGYLTGWLLATRYKRRRHNKIISKE